MLQPLSLVTVPPPRTVIVQPPSLMRETGGVIRAVFHIIFWSAAVMGTTWGRGAGSQAVKAAPTAVDEVAFRDLDPTDQRMYRQCLEGLTEAEDVRSKADWPTIEQLGARKIPPFASDPLDHAGYTWRVLRDRSIVNYVGTPDPASKRPTFVIVIVEPEPGAPIDPQAVTDETHHKLRDGTIIHVSIWTGSRTLATAASTPAFEDGWRRITMATP